MEGIEVSEEELNSFAELMIRLELSTSIDSIIPLPNLNIQDQMERLANCDHENTAVKYFERRNGQHGWCCSFCGKVVQWG